MKKTFFLTSLILCSLAFASDIDSTDTGRVKPIFKDKKYVNPYPKDSVNFSGALRAKKAQTKPSKPLPVQKVDIKQAFPNNKEGLYVTRLGHSSLLMQLDGVRLLIDPVFTNNVSPVFFVKVPRFQENAPTSVEELPFIDAVFISHDHFDHLDQKAILALAPKTGYFIVPSGVGKYFQYWGIDSAQVREYAWWEGATIQGLSGQTMRFVCTPARHFSGRSLSRNRTLWASWVFIGSSSRVFYSGDTSYGFHFKQIGHHYGPFDLTIMENGQYSVNWPNSHIFPEEGVLAHIDLRGKMLLPVHWGTFDISNHDWWEPIERSIAAAEPHKIPVLTPKIGQTLHISETPPATQAWWREFVKKD